MVLWLFWHCHCGLQERGWSICLSTVSLLRDGFNFLKNRSPIHSSHFTLSQKVMCQPYRIDMAHALSGWIFRYWFWSWRRQQNKNLVYLWWNYWQYSEVESTGNFKWIFDLHQAYNIKYFFQWFKICVLCLPTTPSAVNTVVNFLKWGWRFLLRSWRSLVLFRRWLSSYSASPLGELASSWKCVFTKPLLSQNSASDNLPKNQKH